MKKRTKCFLISLAVAFSAGCSPVQSTSTLPFNSPMPMASDEAVQVVAQDQEQYKGDETPISRAVVAKMLAAAFNDLNTINTMDRVIEFSDTSHDQWFDKYINAVYSSGFMMGSGKIFNPDGNVTLEQAQILLDKLDKNKSLKLKITEETKTKPISYAVWTEIYQNLLKNLSGEKSVSEFFGIDEKKYIILATPTNNSKLKTWSVVTDRGPLANVGLNLDTYLNKQIRVLVKDGDIVAVLGVESVSPTIKNAFVTATSPSAISIFTGGVERTFNYENTLTDATGKICDITINGSDAKGIKLSEEKTRDEILLTNTKKIEFRNKPNLEIGEDFKIYSSVDHAVKWKGLNDLVVGTSIAEFIIKDGKACAAIITENASAKNLRIVIGTSGFSGMYHKEVKIGGTKGFSVKISDEVKNYKASEELQITDAMFEKNPRIFIEPLDGGLISLNSVKRNWLKGESPKYRGKMEIYKDEKGYVIVNTVTLEEYLYAVVPSEMPSSYGVEASKVQAITARSYAYNQFFANRYHSYGANIDDSVSCQVYNNTPENETAIKAVNETKNQFLTYDGDVISANFFSTSSGYTANNGEVWAHSTTKQFPTNTSEYLKSVKQFSGDDIGELSKEEVAAKFFKDTTVKAYDSNVSWFRWNTTMTAKEIESTINATIKGRYEANPPLIKTLQEGGVYRSRPIETIGELKDLEVTKRGAAGNIMEMKIVGSAATVLVCTEYNVRALVKPVQMIKDAKPIMTNRKDGTVVSNYTIMPSAFYVMEKNVDESGTLKSVKFIGGGNGHGVGMSQNGVRGMITAGFSVNDILMHYYSGTEVTNIE